MFFALSSTLAQNDCMRFVCVSCIEDTKKHGLTWIDAKCRVVCKLLILREKDW